jgi:PAS domain S-box-containing protein
MDVVLKQVPFHIVGVDAVGFSLIDWEKKHTSVALLHLQGGAHIEDEAFRLSESLMGDLVKHRRPVVIYDLQTDPRIQNYREIIRQYGLKSYLGVPLVAQDQTIGLLHVLTTQPRYFRDEEVDFFATMAGQAGIALRNAQFFEEIKASEERYRSLFDQMPLGLYRTTPEGKIIDVNPALVQILGYPDQESLLGINVAETYVDPKDRVQWQSLIDHEGIVGNYEMQLRRRDGTIIWVEENTRVIRNPEGQVLYYEGGLQDITERKRMEETLKFTRFSIDNAADTMVCVDHDARFVDVNDAFCRSVGYSREELLSMTVHDIDPDYSAEIWPEFWKKLKQSGSLTFETCHRNKEGRIFPVEITANFLEYNGKEYHCSFARDITERKRTEEVLQESEERYRLLFENSLDAILLTVPDGRILKANPAACTIFGRTEEELIQLGRSGVIDTTDPRLPGALEERARTGKFRGELNFLRKGGTKFPTEITSVLFKDRFGNQRTSMIIRDIAERKRAEKERDQFFEQVHASRERLRNLSRRLVEVQEVERHDLVRRLHDEVGQNLTALSINLNIVHSQLPPETVTKTAIRIDDSLKLVEETVERIRDVMAELRPPVLDDYGVTAALHWYGKQFSERTGIPTVLKVEELKPRLPLPVETALFRIAQEALTNVAKYAQAKNVTVELEEFGKSVQLSIADDGIGFDSEAHHQPEAKPEWGLINMRERSQAIGGQLSVETAPGKGTQIIVEVPRKH